MFDRQFIYSTYSQPAREYPRVDPSLEHELVSALATLITDSERAWLHADYALSQVKRRNGSESFSHVFQDFFGYFDVELRAQIYELVGSGTLITCEVVEDLLNHPLDDNRDIARRASTFPDDFLHRTCDVGHGWTTERELDYVAKLIKARFWTIAESGVYLVRYEKTYPRTRGSTNGCDYVVMRHHSLKWLDLADDTGEFSDLNFVFIQ